MAENDEDASPVPTIERNRSHETEGTFYPGATRQQFMTNTNKSTAHFPVEQLRQSSQTVVTMKGNGIAQTIY